MKGISGVDAMRCALLQQHCREVIKAQADEFVPGMYCLLLLMTPVILIIFILMWVIIAVFSVCAVAVGQLCERRAARRTTAAAAEVDAAP